MDTAVQTRLPRAPRQPLLPCHLSLYVGSQDHLSVAKGAHGNSLIPVSGCGCGSRPVIVSCHRPSQGRRLAHLEEGQGWPGDPGCTNPVLSFLRVVEEGSFVRFDTRVGTGAGAGEGGSSCLGVVSGWSGRRLWPQMGLFCRIFLVWPGCPRARGRGCRKPAFPVQPSQPPSGSLGEGRALAPALP